MKVKVTVTPVKGKARDVEVDIKTGSTVAEALQAADCGTKGFNLFLNGEPVKPDTKIDGSVKLRAEEVATVSATERVAGS